MTAPARDTDIRITRHYEVPVAMVWSAWTDSEQVAQWWGPRGFTITTHSRDLRPGGTWVYTMNGPDVIEYAQCFTDAHGNVSRHPGAPTWPETMRTRVTFTAEGPAQTRVTVCWAVEGEATAAELASFMAGRGGMTQGWTGSFDKLEALLSV